MFGKGSDWLSIYGNKNIGFLHSSFNTYNRDYVDSEYLPIV